MSRPNPRGFEPVPSDVESSSRKLNSTAPSTTLKAPPNAPSKGLNVRNAVSSYFDRLLQFVPGMKVILFDNEAKMTFSLVTTQSQILERSVFLTSSLIKQPKFNSMGELEPEEKMVHLKCLVICKPTEQNLHALSQHLNTPLYGEYNVFFTAPVSPGVISRLAEMDAKRMLIKQVVELYCDYLAVNSDLFEFHQPGLKSTQGNSVLVGKLLTVLLSLRQRPTIRYSLGSDPCQGVARELLHEINQNRSLFEFGNLAPPSHSTGETLLLLLDRREDPVTPLLQPWTYQAMVHELLELEYNVVDLGKEFMDSNPGKLESSQVVLSQSDDFFLGNMFKDYGALANNTQKMLDEYKTRFASNKSQLSSVEGMTNVLESLPEFKKFANNAIKHGAVVGELTRLLAAKKLIETSTLEQELACGEGDHLSHLERVKLKLKDPEVEDQEKLKFVMLYALRYETSGNVRLGELKQLLRAQKLTESQIRTIDQLMQYAGANKRTVSELYGEDGFNKLLNFKRNVFFGGGGDKPLTQNALLMHKPWLSKVLEDYIVKLLYLCMVEPPLRKPVWLDKSICNKNTKLEQLVKWILKFYWVVQECTIPQVFFVN
ncbi:hypothetical protein BASA81_013265 [Batrachochytrium salamandrivorans]|nr:hypothetical protein BASA81_013265 [Batrachochytrium salamandrivorans]